MKKESRLLYIGAKKEQIMSSNFSRKYKSFFYISFAISAFFILFYLLFRIVYFIIADYMWYEKILAFFLLLAESFVLIHTLGYFLNLFLVKKEAFKESPKTEKKIENYPPIAIVVASYKEPIAIVKDTLICFYNISYPNKFLYFLDDTQYDLPWDTPENKLRYRREVEELCEWLGINLFRAQWHGAKAGMINDFLQFLDGKRRDDFEFYPYQEKIKTEKEKYLIIFDADMNAVPDFAEDLVRMLENRPKTAFIQTPQYYTNFETNRVARAAGIQQAIFYEYICEGKSLKDAMFCCGTNVVFRIEALMDVGGFDETSVTEDFATSLKLHKKGWQSLYVNRNLSFGMGPEDLGAFFKQQFRWATGTVSVLRDLPKIMWHDLRRFTLGQWWEYFLASTHYFVGWVLFIMIISPLAFLLFDTPSYFANPEMYFLAFTPYIILTSFMFFWTIMERKYRFTELMSALLINIVSFPVFMKASFYGLMGIKTKFGITPKEGAHILSFKSLIPQILTALLCTFGITWGLLRLYYEREPFYALLTNVFWTVFNLITLSYFLYLNHSQEGEAS